MKIAVCDDEERIRSNMLIILEGINLAKSIDALEQYEEMIASTWEEAVAVCFVIADGKEEGVVKEVKSVIEKLKVECSLAQVQNGIFQ